ncbi:uncharacterized protein [Coffea arabica]|uniref:Uncharacterized protein isoform X3 n=1 Tax=Coffea arabica TaxID=13443 RepID=A0ABM4X0M5_COFAR|nr:ribosomal RNA small subunit methyltransferase NEP1-like [Coffea arabica]
MRLIENPLDKHLPLNSLKIGLSFSSSKAVNLRDYVTTISNDCTLVFIIDAMAHGKIDTEHTDDLISVSSLPLSARVCVRHVCCELERQWEIL